MTRANKFGWTFPDCDHPRWRNDKNLLTRYFIVLAVFIAATLLSGCQAVNVVEYYEPNEQNAAYSVKATGEKPGLGPVKRIESKSGIRDWSQNMNIKTSVSVLGL